MAASRKSTLKTGSLVQVYFGHDSAGNGLDLHGIVVSNPFKNSYDKGECVRVLWLKGGVDTVPVEVLWSGCRCGDPDCGDAPILQR